MALINDPNVTAQIKRQIDAGTLTAENLVALVNPLLPTGQQISAGSGVSTGVYKRFGEFDKVNAKTEVVTTGLWSGDSGSLTAFYTSSIQSQAKSGYYYIDVYEGNPMVDSSQEHQFAIAYGNINGYGSMTLDLNDSALLATKGTYAQYRSILLDSTTTNFSFQNSAGGTTDSDDIYVINIARSRFREQMDPGNWEMKLSGSNGIFHFIDDSGKKFGDNFGKSGRVFNIVSGALNLGTQNEATIKSTTDATNGLGFGTFYPDRGLIILNPAAIGKTVGNIPTQIIYTKDGVTTISGNLSGSASTAAEQFNQIRLFAALKGAGDFEARRTENVHTQHFFVRATNREFNYSNNPTYVDAATGLFNEKTFETDPQTYITTVGLLNDSNELIAVAKTSQPINKSFDKEVLIKVKLSF
jgi:hypothetical protein